MNLDAQTFRPVILLASGVLIASLAARLLAATAFRSTPSGTFDAEVSAAADWLRDGEAVTPQRLDGTFVALDGRVRWRLGDDYGGRIPSDRASFSACTADDSVCVEVASYAKDTLDPADTPAGWLREIAPSMMAMPEDFSVSSGKLPSGRGLYWVQQEFADSRALIALVDGPACWHLVVREAWSSPAIGGMPPAIDPVAFLEGFEEVSGVPDVRETTTLVPDRTWVQLDGVRFEALHADGAPTREGPFVRWSIPHDRTVLDVYAEARADGDAAALARTYGIEPADLKPAPELGPNVQRATVVREGMTLWVWVVVEKGVAFLLYTRGPASGVHRAEVVARRAVATLDWTAASAGGVQPE